MKRIVFPNVAWQWDFLGSGKFGPADIVPSFLKISVVIKSQMCVVDNNAQLPYPSPPVNQMESPIDVAA